MSVMVWDLADDLFAFAKTATAVETAAATFAAAAVYVAAMSEAAAVYTMAVCMERPLCQKLQLRKLARSQTIMDI